MHIVTVRHIEEAARRYPDAGLELEGWVRIVKALRWRNFVEVRKTFPSADGVRGFVVFNVRRNRFRLITVIHYSRIVRGMETQGHVYIRAFLTHQEYDDPANWDRRFGR